jgi:hypothetical protein
MNVVTSGGPGGQDQEHIRKLPRQQHNHLSALDLSLEPWTSQQMNSRTGTLEQKHSSVKALGN